MKANPKKLGGRKGDRMTPDWLDGYVIVGLTDHQVVLRNTKTNKVLKSISLAHIKPFRDRTVDGNVKGDEVEGEKVEGVNDEVEDVNDKGEDVGDEGVSGDVEGVGGEDEGVGGEVEGVGGEVEDVDDEGKDVGGEGKDVGEIKGVCGSKVEDVGSSKVAQTFDGEVERLKKLSIRGVSLREPFLDFGPVKLTTKDIWSIIPPREIPTFQYEMLKNAVPDFKPGWLSDMVS